MSQSPSSFDINHLSQVEKLELIGRLWDSLPATPADFPIPDWHQAEIEQRLARADADPNAAIPWDEFERRLREHA